MPLYLDRPVLFYPRALNAQRRAQEGLAASVGDVEATLDVTVGCDYPRFPNNIVFNKPLAPVTWDSVLDERNVHGATAIAVPGLVDGMGKLRERFGTMPWAELVEPAIGLAREGLLVDWYAALLIASSARVLAQDPDAAALYLEDRQWPTVSGWTALADKRLDMSKMVDSLQQIADHGARTLYEGDLASMLAQDVQAKGGSLSVDDLRAYHAQFFEPLSFGYRDARFDVMPGLTAGPTFRDALRVMAGVFWDVGAGGTPAS